MKTISFNNVDLLGGYLFDKQELNRKITIDAVYDRFYDTGRIGAFNFDYTPETPEDLTPHIYWDSDVAKWMEGACYILKKHNDPKLEAKVDALVAKIKEHQCEDGYFNIHFTIVEPELRFKERKWHELYCAGHLMEAAVAYAEATGKTDFLDCMEKYADLIHKVFVVEKSAGFSTPGHQEIELALIRMYLYTGKKKFLDLAKHFIDTRGVVEESWKEDYNQSHLPVREQTEAVGHSVRAMYLYTGMAMLAKEIGDEALADACKKLWEDTTLRKMYITGGLGSTPIGEAFSNPFDLPNDQAYTETCAGIGLMFFANAMLCLENDAKYADVTERILYNGVLSGLSIDGKAFFYENPLEINLSERFQNFFGKRRFPITQRLECFHCSCCPPNINRLLPSLGNYIYGSDGDTLYVNQFVSSTLSDGKISCIQNTNYPLDGKISVKAEGVAKIAVRIPSWCKSFKANKPYSEEKGYAIFDGNGEVVIELDMTPTLVYADPRVIRDTGRVCITRGPIVYCAEGVDNGNNLHAFVIPQSLEATEAFSEAFGLHTLDIKCRKRLPFSGCLYSSEAPKFEDTTLRLIPYNCFANRGETDMLVWFSGENR